MTQKLLRLLIVLTAPIWILVAIAFIFSLVIVQFLLWCVWPIYWIWTGKKMEGLTFIE